MANKEAKLKIIVDAQDNSRGTFTKLNQEMGGLQRSTLSTVSVLGSLATAGAAALTGFLGYGVKIAADLETAEIGLTTLLGSADDARATVERLKKEASRTPFELPGLTQAAQLLTSVTKDGNKSIDVILDIGEALAAMGKGQVELDRIIVNLQQVAATGRAAMVDIKQFAYAGIPIFEMLQEKTGLAGEALEQFVADGGVTFELLTEMFDEANDSGGRFFNAFVNQAGSFSQTLSNLKDSFGLFLADIVQNSGIFDGLVVSMQVAADFLGNYQLRLAQLGETIRSIGQTIDEATGLLTLFSDVWANLVMVFNDRLKPSLDELWLKLQPFKPFFDALVQVIGTGLLIAVGGLIMILGTLSIVLIEVLNGAVELANFFLGTFGSAWDWITDRIASAIEVVEEFVRLMERALSFVGELPGSVGKGIADIFSVDDAVISPNGDIITTHPDDYIIATKDPQSLGGRGGVTVNINGGTFLSEDVAEQIGDMIIGKAKLSAQF